MFSEILNGIPLYRFAELDAAGVIHAVLTRQGGVSRGGFATLNLGHTVGDDPAAVEENHRRVYSALGVHQEQVVSPYQVHSADVRLVGKAHAGTVQPNTDGLLTTTPGVAIFFRFADCTPIVVFDPVRHAVGLIHAGWRGIARGVVPAAVEAFRRLAGSRVADMWAGIGPTIGPCCYEVGQDVADAVVRSSGNGNQLSQQRDGSIYLDLPSVVRVQLSREGVNQIEMSHQCTACNTEEWFSHRAEKGHTGRFGIVVMLEH
jgi:YfiH family protein